MWQLVLKRGGKPKVLTLGLTGLDNVGSSLAGAPRRPSEPRIIAGMTRRRQGGLSRRTIFHRHKLTEGLSSRTVRYLHAVLHKALKQAADDGLIPRDAAASAKPPQLRQAEIRPLSPLRPRHSWRQPMETGWKPSTYWLSRRD